MSLPIQKTCSGAHLWARQTHRTSSTRSTGYHDKNRPPLGGNTAGDALP